MGSKGEVKAMVLTPCECPHCGFVTAVLRAPKDKKIACCFDCRVQLGEISAKVLIKPRDALPKPRTPQEKYVRKLAAQRWENNEMESIRESWI